MSANEGAVSRLAFTGGQATGRLARARRPRPIPLPIRYRMCVLPSYTTITRDGCPPKGAPFSLTRPPCIRSRRGAFAARNPAASLGKDFPCVLASRIRH